MKNTKLNEASGQQKKIVLMARSWLLRYIFIGCSRL